MTDHFNLRITRWPLIYEIWHVFPYAFSTIRMQNVYVIRDLVALSVLGHLMYEKFFEMF